MSSLRQQVGSLLWLCVPINGVDFIMGDDLAAGKVYRTPKVVTVPLIESLSDDLVAKHPDIFRACA